MRKRHLTVAVLSSLAVTAVSINLAACGGGGAGGTVRPSNPVPPTVTNYNENVASGATSTIDDDLGGAGSMTLTGGGTLILTGTNTFTGGTTITSSTLQLGDGSTKGSIVGDVADNGTLAFYRSDDVQFDGTISGTGALFQGGTGTLTLTGGNTYTGTTTIGDGNVALAGSGSIADSEEVDLLYGAFDISGTTNGAVVKSLSGTGSVVLGDKTLTIENGLPDAHLIGIISGTGGVTLMNGSFNLMSPNTYTGLTTIYAGANLTIGAEPDDVNGSVTGDIVDNGVLDFAGFSGMTYGKVISGSGSVIHDRVNTLTLTAANTYSGGTTINAGALQLGDGGTSGSIIGDVTDNGSLVFNRSDSVTFDGVVSGTGSVAQAGAGTLMLTGVNTYSGGTFVNAGVLQVSSDASLGATGGNVLINNGTLRAGGSLTLSHNVVVENTASFDTNGNALTLAGSTALGSACVCGVAIVKDGAGTLTLSGPTSFAAGLSTVFNINAGTVALSASGVLGAAYLNMVDGAAFDISQSTAGSTVSINALNGGGEVALGGNNVAIGAWGLSWTFGGVISDGGIGGGNGGSVTMAGGLGTLTAENTYSGETSIENGILKLSGSGGISNSRLVYIAPSYGTLDISGTTGGATVKALSGGGSLELGGQTLTVSDADAANAFDGVISGTGSLVVSGGTLILNGLNTYSGGTTIENGGELQASRGLQGSVAVGDGGKLAGSGVGSNLSNAGTVAVHGGDTAVGGNYTQASTGTLAVNLGSKLAVTGTATLNGGTLEVTGADNGYVADTHTDVLTATGGVTGTFDQLVKDSGVVFTSTTIGYGANDVYLDTTGLNITVAAASMGIVEPEAVSAAQRVQTGFDAINAATATGGTISPDVLLGAGAIQHSATPAVAQGTLESLSGQLHAASAAMLFDGSIPVATPCPGISTIS